MNEPRIIRPYPGFIIPTRRFVDVGMPSAKVGASGRYKLFKVRNGERTGEETPWFDNIILDSGLNRWGTGTIISGAAISTGTSVPAATDTDLQVSPYHYTTGSGTGAGLSAGIAPNYNNTRTFSYRTVLGQLNGNYSEVGVGWANGSMFSRALILDGGGSPLPITVTSSEQLDIVYQLSVYPPLVDTGPTKITISGVDYDVTGRASRVTSISAGGWAVTTTGAPSLSSSSTYSFAFSGAIGAITATPSGGGDQFSGTTNNAYVNNSLQSTGSLSANLTSGNAPGGIMSVLAGWLNISAFQYNFDPVIPKDGTKTLVLNFSRNWARR